jgi:hypothetical protein
VLYRFTHMGGASFLSEFFKDDNPAAGVSLLGFAFACNYMFVHVANMVRAEGLELLPTIGLLAGVSLALILLLGILRSLFIFMVNVTQSTNMRDEMFEQNNVGAAFIDAGITVGSAVLLVATFVSG